MNKNYTPIFLRENSPKACMSSLDNDHINFASTHIYKKRDT